MFIYAAVKKYRSKREKEKVNRDTIQQSGQSAFSSSSQPSYISRKTQAAGQVGLPSYAHPTQYPRDVFWGLTSGNNSKTNNSVDVSRGLRKRALADCEHP